MKIAITIIGFLFGSGVIMNVTMRLLIWILEVTGWEREMPKVILTGVVWLCISTSLLVGLLCLIEHLWKVW